VENEWKCMTMFSLKADFDFSDLELLKDASSKSKCNKKANFFKNAAPVSYLSNIPKK
jgi:hypothetical protein